MPFHPTDHNFSLLPDHNPAPGVKFHELKNHPAINGTPNYHRLNIYLSQDGDFVTIWFGLLETAMLTIFREMDPPDYDELLFRGYIETPQDATVILKSLGLDNFSPNKIEKLDDGTFTCSLLPV